MDPIEVLGPVLKKGAKWAGVKLAKEIGLKEVVPFAGPGLIAVDCFDKYAKSVLEDALKEAQATINCSCLRLCSDGGNPITDSVLAVQRKKGCSFIFKTAPLWHPFARLDASKLAARVMRYDPVTNNVGTYNFPVTPCPSCCPMEKK